MLVAVLDFYFYFNKVIKMSVQSWAQRKRNQCSNWLTLHLSHIPHSSDSESDWVGMSDMDGWKDGCIR